MLVNGYGHAQLAEVYESPAPAPFDTGTDFGDPISFRSQKERVVRKLKLLLVIGSLFTILGLVLVL